MLKLHYEKEHILWTEKYMHLTDLWLSAFFREEKNIDGLDGWAYHLSSLIDNKERILSWCGLCILFQRENGYCFFFNGRQFSEEKWNVLENNLLPIGNILEGENCIRMMSRFIPPSQQHLGLRRIKWLLETGKSLSQIWIRLKIFGENLQKKNIDMMSVFDSLGIKATNRAELVFLKAPHFPNTSLKPVWLDFKSNSKKWMLNFNLNTKY